MSDRRHGRTIPQNALRIPFTWRFGSGAALLSALVGCQIPLSWEAERSPAIVYPSGKTVVATASSVSRRRDAERLDKHEDGGVVKIAAQTEVEKAPLQEPELLPLPERVAEPIPAPSEPSQADATPLSLPEALAASLARNPDLTTLRGQLSVSQSMVDVAKAPIWNPFVQAQYFPNGRPLVPNKPGEPASGAGQSNFYVWAMQRFELAHQRRYRTQSALAAVDQTQWSIFQGELLNVSQTVKLYFTALYQGELNDLATAGADLNDRLLRVVERRNKANLAVQSAVTTARIAARQSRRQAELAETAYQAALLALHQQLNIPMGAPLTLTDRLTDVRWLSVRGGGRPVDEASLAAELVEGRPDVMAARVGIQVAEANWRLAQAARVPDVQAGPIYETADDGTRYLGLRLQMDFPVRNTGGPLARERRQQVNQQALTYEQLRIKAGFEAQAAIAQYERVLEMAAKSAPEQADGGPADLQEITRMFEAGQADVLAVIAMQNTLLQERKIQLDVLNQLAQASAIVIQATGLPPSRLIAGRPDELPRAIGDAGPAPDVVEATHP